MNNQAAAREHVLGDALELLTSALALLDRVEADAQIGAHVDLAVHQLASSIGPRARSAKARPVPRVAEKRR